MLKRHSALDANYLPGSYSLERKISLKFKEFSNLQSQIIDLNNIVKTEKINITIDEGKIKLTEI